MDRVISARLDEKIIEELDFATKRLRMTKKQFLEEAIRLRAKETRLEETLRIIDESFGAWKRDDETIDETVATIRASRAAEEERRQAYFDSLGPETRP